MRYSVPQHEVEMRKMKYIRFNGLSRAAIPLVVFLVSGSTAAYAQESPEIANVPDSLKDRVSTSADGLVEEFAISGTKVDLQGRFQNFTAIKIDKDGNAKVQHHSPGADLDALFESGKTPPHKSAINPKVRE